MVFADRIQAGRALAKALDRFKSDDSVVLGLPRGGVVPAAEVADVLATSLDAVVVKKITLPSAPEYAVGAVTENGEPIWNPSELSQADSSWRQRQVQSARHEVRQRRLVYDRYIAAPSIRGRLAIVVDDGVATGLTMIAAARELRRRRPARLVMAVPVAPEDELGRLASFYDDVLALHSPEGFFGAIGDYYQDFEQVTDDQVIELLAARGGAEERAQVAEFLSTVAEYPLTGAEAVELARSRHAPASVVGFFEQLPRDTQFQTKSEVLERQMELDLLEREEAEQPDDTAIEDD